MDLEQGLLTRRSVRRFIKNRTIPQKTMQEMLNIASHAPSARDTQCWEFIILDDKDKFSKIAEIHPYAGFLKDASAAVFVCGNKKTQMSENSWIVDTANASLQLCLAAHAKGIASCWCGIYPDKERISKFTQLLELPSFAEPLSMIVLGYQQEEPKQPMNRYDIKKIHSNKW